MKICEISPIILDAETFSFSEYMKMAWQTLYVVRRIHQPLGITRKAIKPQKYYLPQYFCYPSNSQSAAETVDGLWCLDHGAEPGLIPVPSALAGA